MKRDWLKMNDDKIAPKQVLIIFMLSTGLVNHVMAIPILLEVSGRDAWVSVLVTAALYAGWIAFLYWIVKNMKGKPFFEWIRERFGLLLAWLLSMVVAIFLFLMMFITFKDTLTWTITSYFPQTPILILALLFAAIAYFCASSNIQSLGISAAVILFFVIILGFFVMTTNFMYKDYTRLFPIFEKGFSPALQGIIYSGGGLAEIALIILLQHRISPKIRLKNMWFLGFVLIGLTLGPLMGSITIFGVSEASHQRYPAYEQWRLLQIGKYISHVDFFSIYQWLSGTLIRISILLYLSADLFPLPTSHRKWLLRILSLLLVGASLFRIGDAELYAFIKHVYFPASLCFFVGLSLFMGMLILVKRG